MYTCVYIYIEREREKERYNVYIYIYILFMCVHCFIVFTLFVVVFVVEEFLRLPSVCFAHTCSHVLYVCYVVLCVWFVFIVDIVLLTFAHNCCQACFVAACDASHRARLNQDNKRLVIR